MSQVPDVTHELRRAWLASGRSLEDIGQQMGVTGATVSRILGGQRDTSISRLQRLANALGYDLALIPRETP